MNSDLTPKQQASQAIGEAETILITSGQFPSVDQVAAVLGLTLILKKLGKKVYGVISDQLPKSVSFLPVDQLTSGFGETKVAKPASAPAPKTEGGDLVVEIEKAKVDKLRYSVTDGKLSIFLTPTDKLTASDVHFRHVSAEAPAEVETVSAPEVASSDLPNFDVVIVLGVPTKARVDKVVSSHPQLAEVPIINLDFHRTNDNYGGVNMIDPYAASLCEILVSIAESLQQGVIDEPIATVLLTGIVASTDRFTATHTSAKALTVAAQMIAAGAKQQTVIQNLYRSGGDHDRERRHDRGKRDSRDKRRDTRSEQPKPETKARPEQESDKETGGSSDTNK